MGYVEPTFDLPTNVKKGTLSLWFRAPAATLAAARAEYLVWRDARPRPARPPLIGVVPLAVFGPPVHLRGVSQETREIGTTPEIQVWSWFNDTECSGTDPWALIDTVSSQTTNGQYEILNDVTYAADPCYIGIDVTGDTPQLSINLVMTADSAPTIKGGGYVVSETSPEVIAQVQVGGGSVGGCPGQPVVYSGNPLRPLGCIAQATSCPISTAATYTTTYDGSGDIHFKNRPETFRTSPQAALDNSGSVDGSESLYDAPDPNYVPCEVTPDHWHHVLFSFDLTPTVATSGRVNGTSSDTYDTGARTSSAVRMWLAFDDNNLTRHKLSCYTPRGYFDPNAVLSVIANTVAVSTVSAGVDGPRDDCFGMSNTFVTVADKLTYSYQPSGVPFAAAPFGLPATSTYVSSVRRVEMAEFQFFAGTSLDTGIVSNRRAFITGEGRPASVAKAAELIGVKPDILIHKSANWKKGRNTGVITGTSPAPDGVFVGDIETYKPNPSLFGRQGE